MLLSGCGDGTTGSDPAAPSESVTNSADIEPSGTASAPVSEAPSESPSEEPSGPVSAEPSDSPSEEPSAPTSEEPSPPASAEPSESEDTAHYTIYACGPNDTPLDTITRDFKLRGIDQSSSTYTRDVEPEQITANDLYVLTKGGKIVIDGLRTGEDPTDWVYISAWSDPDGEGIFVQHMFVVTKNDPITTSLDEGPFELVSYDGKNKQVHFPYYFLHGLYGSLEDAPSSIEVSAEFLTELFGANTILQLEIFTQGYFEGEFGTDGHSYYPFYIPAN